MADPTLDVAQKTTNESKTNSSPEPKSGNSTPIIEGEFSHTPQGSVGEYSTDLSNHQHRATLYEPLSSGSFSRTTLASARRRPSLNPLPTLPVDAALRKHLILKYKVNQEEDEEGFMYKFLVAQHNQSCPTGLTKVSSVDSEGSEGTSPVNLNEPTPPESEYTSDNQDYLRNKRTTVYDPMPGRLSSSDNSIITKPNRKITKAIQHPVRNLVQDAVSSSPPPESYIPPVTSTPTPDNNNNNTVLTKLKSQYPDVDITSKALYKVLDFITDMESAIIEQAVQFATEAQKAKHSENQDGKVTVFSQDVTRAVLVMLGVSAVELSPPKSEIISSYFDTIDHLMLDFENLFYANDWIPMKEKKGVEMARRVMPNSDLNCIRGSALIAASADTIKNTLFSPKFLQSIDPLLISTELVEILDKQTHVMYMVYGATFCVLRQKRDFVLLYHWYRRKDGTLVVLGQSVEHKDKPVSKDYIRGDILESGYVITPQQGHPNLCQVTYIAHIDIKGTLPEYLRAKFSNIIQETQPLNLLRLRKLLTGKETVS